MRFWPLTVFLAAAPLFAQSYPSQDLVNLREDVRLLNQRVGELTLKIEQLEHANSNLQRKAEAGNVSYVTLTQLNDAIAEINRTIKASVGTSKGEILQIVATQMEKLANQTNAALDSLSRSSPAVRPVSPSAPTAPASSPASSGEDYPKEGISYTVVKGDTLAKIAQKTGARSSDIAKANKITDPSKIQAGQVLFIPGGK